MVQELWSDIRDMSVNLLDDAVMIGKHKASFVLKEASTKIFFFFSQGNAKDLHSLMETWKEICIRLTF